MQSEVLTTLFHRSIFSVCCKCVLAKKILRDAAQTTLHHIFKKELLKSSKSVICQKIVRGTVESIHNFTSCRYSKCFIFKNQWKTPFKVTIIWIQRAIVCVSHKSIFFGQILHCVVVKSPRVTNTVTVVFMKKYRVMQLNQAWFFHCQRNVYHVPYTKNYLTCFSSNVSHFILMKYMLKKLKKCHMLNHTEEWNKFLAIWSQINTSSRTVSQLVKRTCGQSKLYKNLFLSLIKKKL